ncbi:fibroin heavy chain isoform X2 [Armigeres subalbatus]|uniref:fibroin heavy chain isoform X2 n=2 Tax=Armigeres subalbatus TaxID=124917 RepID=UPI002ED653AF
MPSFRRPTVEPVFFSNGEIVIDERLTSDSREILPHIKCPLGRRLRFIRTLETIERSSSFAFFCALPTIICETVNLKVIMIKFVIISALVAGASAGYASSQYAGAGFNGGFASQYGGPNGVGASAGSGAFVPGFAPFQPVPVFPSAFDFNSFYQGLQANFANLAATQAYALGGATAVASASQFDYPGYYQPAAHQPIRGQQHSASSNSYHSNNYNNAYNMYQQQLAHQNALFNQIRQQQAFAANAAAGAGAGAGVGSGFGSGANFGGPGYAGSSAAYGPGGIHQTAHIYPENPQSPNIDIGTRFGEGQPQGGPGFVGVSSFSSSSNINGQTHREASSTVNDNGKVTSYHVRS